MMNVKFVDTEELSAWSTGRGIIRIKTRIPQIAEAVLRLKDTWQIGESLEGGYLRLFHTTQCQRKVETTLKGILTRISSQGDASQKPRRSRARFGRCGDSGQLHKGRSRVFQRQNVPTRRCARRFGGVEGKGWAGVSLIPSILTQNRVPKGEAR